MAGKVMASPGDRYREFAFAAADLLVSADAQGRVLHAAGDATLLHHPTADRLLGRNVLDLISEGETGRLKTELWALGPGRRLTWDDRNPTMEGGRRIVVQRDIAEPDTFNVVLSRKPMTRTVQGNRPDDVMADRFRDAVMNGRLLAARQPVVETRTGVISHYEVLARFQGEDSPIGLITAAERSGQICHLDYIMVNAAAERLETERDPTFRLAVNISGESIQRVDVIRELCAAITSHTFRRSRLIIEVTESAEINDIEAAAEGIRRLRACGIAVSLDDFGSGAASFNYLRALEFDGLKFDGSFLDRQESNHRNFALMRSVARMCQELGIFSVGERVETEADRKMLEDAGIRYAQGYLFGTPVIDETFLMPAARRLAGAA
jgi:EAL domain-containing protein (putative c-di-GMP-specific phosphodiesterase class I)